MTENAPLEQNELENKNITQDPPQEQKTQEQTPDNENREDKNWRAFREARKRDREEREAAERRASEKEREIQALKAAMEAAFSKQAPTPQAYQQYYGIEQPNESEEQVLERKLEQMLSAREQKLREQQQERERREYPERLTRDFRDFHQVCSAENLDYLDYHYPEISKPLQRLEEGYDKWHDIYYAVKRFLPNAAESKKEIAKADMNSMKPRAAQSISAPPQSVPMRETWQDAEQRRALNWQRMQRIMSGVS